MIDPSLPLQAAIVAVLSSDTALHVAVHGGVKVYDRVPSGVTPPYVHMRSTQVIEDGNSEGDAAEVVVDIDVWSEATGQVQAKTIGKAVVDALDRPIEVAGFATVVGHAQTATYATEPDGLTTRGALSFRYLIDEQE